MSNGTFVKLAKGLVCEWYNDPERVRKTNTPMDEDDVYVVWLSKTLQNNKALLSTDVPDDMYFEVTYNGDKREAYLDAYQKVENRCVKEEENDQSRD